MAAPPPIVFFGSIASNLQTFTSDVDAKVLSDDPDLPQFLYTVLAGTVATDARLIAGDRGYVLNYTDKSTGISVDLAFGLTDPTHEGTILEKWGEQYPLFRDLTLLLKFFLEGNSFSEPFKGGIGGFHAAHLVRHFLKHKKPLTLEDAFLQLVDYYLKFDTKNIITALGDLTPKTGDLCKQPWRWIVYDATKPDENVLHACDAKMFKDVLKNANYLLGTKIPFLKILVPYGRERYFNKVKANREAFHDNKIEFPVALIQLIVKFLDEEKARTALLR